jgi:hypothetical protein
LYPQLATGGESQPVGAGVESAGSNEGGLEQGEPRGRKHFYFQYAAKVGVQSVVNGSIQGSFNLGADGASLQGQLNLDAVALQVPFQGAAGFDIPGIVNVQEEEVSGALDAGAIGGKLYGKLSATDTGTFQLGFGGGADVLFGASLQSNTTIKINPVVLNYASQVAQMAVPGYGVATQIFSNFTGE